MKYHYKFFLSLCIICGIVLSSAVMHIWAQEQPGANSKLPEAVPGTEVPKQELSPQLQKEIIPGTETAPKDTQVAKKAEGVDIKKEEKKPVEEAAQKHDAVKGVKVDSKSLLSITEGPFRYSRIPGITIKENSEQIIAHIEEKQNIDTEEKGLFGLSKKASDRMAKIILVVIIVFVFILYRMRTRSSAGSVLRRFPK
ncbi:MAG: hypothetical protein N3F66_08975 [Spirochaetes bacterium]|nr:hypothetical protein [Spirochaetota bacterium]